MSMKKLLALLLALAIVFSLAACGGSKDSDDKKGDEGSSNVDKGDKNNKDDEDDKKKETEPTKPSDEKEIVGTWDYRVEISDAYLKALKEELGQFDLSSDKEVFIDLKMEFEDGKLTIKGDVDEDYYIEFMIDVTIDAVYATTAAQGADKAATDAAFQQQYGMTVEQYVDNQVKLQVAQQKDELHMKSTAKYYKVDDEAGKIYLASTEDGLEDTKEYIEYTMSDGKLTIKKFYDEEGNEAAAPMEMEEIGVTLPWTFEKK